MSTVVVRLYKDSNKPEKGFKEATHNAIGWKFDVEGNLEIHVHNPNDNQRPLKVYKKKELGWGTRIDGSGHAHVEGPVKFEVFGEENQW